VGSLSTAAIAITIAIVIAAAIAIVIAAIMMNYKVDL
jgi:hypothetical protein